MAITNLKDKQVLITGAASGIGRAAVLAFAKRGAHIIATDLNPTALEALKKEVETMGVRCMTHVVDVSSETAMKQFAGVVHATVGQDGPPHEACLGRSSAQADHRQCEKDRIPVRRRRIERFDR